MTQDETIMAFFMNAVRIQALVHTGEDICTCGADPYQPKEEHDISCPLALPSEERS